MAENPIAFWTFRRGCRCGNNKGSKTERIVLAVNLKIKKRVRQNRNSDVAACRDPVTGKSKYRKTYRRMREACDTRNELRQLIDAGKLQSISK